MNTYPEPVSRIVNDYLDRTKVKLAGVPYRETSELIMEIESHIYEAYCETDGEDDVGRILAVLRKLGEPSEVVCERLPRTMFRAGGLWKRPLYILGGIVIAVLSVPLGAWSVGVVICVLSGLAGVLIAYYALAGSMLLVGGSFLLLGLLRMTAPALWDGLAASGLIQMDLPFEPLRLLSPNVECLLLLLIASVFIASGVGMLKVGSRMLRGYVFFTAFCSTKCASLGGLYGGKFVSLTAAGSLFAKRWLRRNRSSLESVIKNLGEGGLEDRVASARRN